MHTSPTRLLCYPVLGGVLLLLCVVALSSLSSISLPSPFCCCLLHTSMGATHSNDASPDADTPAPSGDASSMQQDPPVSDSDVAGPSTLPCHGDGYACYICHTVFNLKQQLLKHVTCAFVFGYSDHLVLWNWPVAAGTPDWLIPLVTNLHQIDHESADTGQQQTSLFEGGREAQQNLEESITWSPKDSKNGLISIDPRLHGSSTNTVVRRKSHVTSQAERVNSIQRKRPRGLGGPSRAQASSGDYEDDDCDTYEATVDMDDCPDDGQNSNATCQVCRILPALHSILVSSIFAASTLPSCLKSLPSCCCCALLLHTFVRKPV
jgi:hypothetical protein